MYIDKIPDDAVLIKDSSDYIDPKGNVYGIESRNNNPNRGKPFIKTQSKVHGYKYVGINYHKKHISKRVHRLVAEAFLPNPNNLPIVMHKDNNKSNNDLSNLKWGTISENTQAAFDDGLIVNDSGYDDSQSIPCDCYNTLDNTLVEKFGSVSQASKATGITISGIMYQLRNPGIPPRKSLYFVPDGNEPLQHDIIVMKSMETDEIIDRFVSIGKASIITKIPYSTISYQIKIGKPERSDSDVYFEKITV